MQRGGACRKTKRLGQQRLAFFRKPPLVRQQPVLTPQRLQLTVLRRAFPRAGHWVFGKQQLGEDSSVLFDFRRGGFDGHPVGTLAHAGRGKDSLAHIDDAHPADANRVHPIGMTEHGDLDPSLAGRVNDARSKRHFNRLTIDRQRNGLRGGFVGGNH